jgi:AhpD family alkylhydroperoxidase
MAHIQVPEGATGILGSMAISPETAKPLNALAELLLRGQNSLSAVDREMIATYVSSQNDCYFCQHAHGAVAAYRLNGNEQLVDSVKASAARRQASCRRGYRSRTAARRN